MTNITPVRTDQSLADFRAQYGAPNVIHRNRFCAVYKWHREAETVLLMEFRSPRAVAYIPVAALADVAAAYA